MATTAPVPVTVLGGYLGSGKTTVVNRVLSRTHDRRIMVVVNDFGSVNIDAELIRSRDGGTLELANGCICCDLSGGMPAVMRQIIGTPTDQVLIEVSGVGDPAPVAAWGRHPGFRPGGVLVCADVETVQSRARDRWVADTVEHQLRAADLLLLSKTDLVGPESTREVTGWLHDLVDVPVIDLQEIDPVMLLDVDARVDLRKSEGHPHPSHTSAAMTHPSEVDRDEVERRLTDLPDAVVRAKGVLRTTDAPDRRTVVQVVGRRIIWSDAGPWTGGRRSRMVLIATPGGDDALVTAVRTWPAPWSVCD